ncbi:MAG TPA: NADH-quinone oxidoreductase subunit N [Chitinophagaceae bacterium]|nr:NADH-quinone oxidoreductase subunit N [Chitinophagaceae bacterium]HNF72426.1 NADH-quinone oxidoreductase subunit N [Chitinophagaceae bacterium]
MNAIVVSAIWGVAMMFAGLLFRKQNTIQVVALLGILVLFGATLSDYHLLGDGIRSFFHMLELNSYNAWFNVLITGCAMMYFLFFYREISAVGKNDADYFALIFFVLCGTYLLSTYSNLLILFLGIEILSIPQYILAASDKENIKSNEAGLKYFLMGSFSTGILLMGITLLYGATGSFDMGSEHFMQVFQQSGGMSTLAFSGVLLLLIAFGFKVSAAPVHFWTPDVYDGTPTAFTPFMATIAKVGVFVAFLRIFHLSFGNVSQEWQTALAAMIVLTLLIGNITAVYQQSVKRMMAYSSIAQAGFMLMSVFAFNAIAWQSIILYAVSYTLASLGVFGALVKMKDYTFEGFNGLARKEPVLAITTAICVMSLAGIPLTGGFFAKYFVLNAVVDQGKWLWLVVVAVLMAAVSVSYYFKLIRSMYFREGNPELTSSPDFGEKAIMIINALLVILAGILPSVFLQ